MYLQRPHSHVALAIFLLADGCAANIYINVGRGWCRDSHGNATSGYKSENTASKFTDAKCRKQCDSDLYCMAYNHKSGQCLIHSPGRSAAPEPSSTWSFFPGAGGAGGADATKGDGDADVTCYKKVAYADVGQGWCRDSHGEITSGYKKSEAVTDSECRTQCDSDRHCVAYSQMAGECLIHAPWRREAPATAGGPWTFWFGSGGTEVTTGDGKSSLKHEGVRCHKKLALQIVGDRLHTYANVGQGWCRGRADGETKLASTSGYKKEGTFKDPQWCRRQCDADQRCMAYVQWESKECIIYSQMPKEPDAPTGWSSWRANGASDITTVEKHGGVTCFKKIEKSGSDGSRRLSAAAAAADAEWAFLV